jgi:hypothetical protein
MSCSAAKPSVVRTASRRFAAFGLIPFSIASETASSTYRPPAVACAAIWTSDAHRPTYWYGTGSSDEFSPQLQRRDVRRLVQRLGELVGSGYTLLTWDAMRSEWDLLASQSQDRVFCRQLASQHVDMVFHVVCARGHRLSLEHAAYGMELTLERPDSHRTTALQRWSEKDCRAALEALSQHVRLTIDLAHVCQEQGLVAWESNSGRRTQLELPQGWLTVEQALQLPTPDVSGLDRPLCRKTFTAWMSGPQRPRPPRPLTAPARKPR